MARLRHRIAQLLPLAVVTLLAATGVQLAASPVGGDATAALASLPITERAVRVTTRTADDPAAQLTEAATALEALGGLTVIEQRLTFPIVVTLVDDADADDGAAPDRVVLAHATDWARRVTLAGTAPVAVTSGPLEVAAPAASGLTLGAELVVGEREIPVVVTALWEPLDADDPLWFADPGLTAGTMTDQGNAVGPLLLADAADLLAVVDRPLQRWTAVADPAAASGPGLAAIARSLAAVPDSLADAGALVQGSSVAGDGGAAVAQLAAAQKKVAAIAVVAPLLAALAGLLALIAASRRLAAGLRHEHLLRLARGAAPTRLLLADAAATALACLPGATVGAGVGLALGSNPSWALGLAGVGWLIGLGGTRHALPADRRRNPWPVLGVTALLALAGLALLQREEVAGTPVALALAGLAAAALLPAIARLAASLAARGNGTLVLLTVRRLAAHRMTTTTTAGAVLGATRTLAVLARRLPAEPLGPLAGPLEVGLLVASVAAVVLTAVVLVLAPKEPLTGRVAAGSGLTARQWDASTAAGLAIALAVGVLVGAGVMAWLGPWLLLGLR